MPTPQSAPQFAAHPKRPAIRAVAFDIDGTAVPNGRHSHPSPRMLAALKQTSPALVLSAATGRSWEVAYQVIGELGLSDPCIISGGTIILDPVSKTILWQVTIDPRATAGIVGIARSHQGHGHRTLYVRGLETLEDLDKFSPQAINTMYMLGVSLAEAPELIAQLNQLPGITVSKALSWDLPEGIDLHITSHMATKEHAVQALAGLVGVPTSQMAGVGDGHNDLHLFNAVGYKVAMDNAVPELKAVADEIIGPVGQDGLARFLESLV
jgi:hydroxymethylpyrimidine pyrophosphatase-like HAD family hydrolase